MECYMKKKILLLLFIITIFSGCVKSQQYGIDILELDHFDFSLNIEQFFQDERIFRGTHDDFSVSVGEHYIDGNSIQMGYIQYSTWRMSSGRPLASFAGVKFESLGIITDEADEKVLMAIGSTSYTEVKDIEKIMDRLLSEFGHQFNIRDSFSGINILFKKEDKVVNLYLDIMVQGRVEKYEELKDQIRDRKEISCKLFVTNPFFDRALDENQSYSGDLTDYN